MVYYQRALVFSPATGVILPDFGGRARALAGSVAMPKLTLLSRISDGLPLAASMEDEKDHRELDAYKAQATRRP